MSTPIFQVVMAERHYRLLPGMGTREWCAYYWGGGVSTQIGQIVMAKPH